MRSLRTIPTQLRGTNFCPSSARFVPSFVMQPNGPKWYETRQNISLESNGLDRECSLRKIPKRLRGTNIYTGSASFPPRFARQPNCPNCTQMVCNTPKHEFRVQWGGSGVFVAKNSNTNVRPFSTEICKATKLSQLHPNGMKYTKTRV